MILEFKQKKGARILVPLNLLVQTHENPPGDCEEFKVGFNKGCISVSFLLKNRAVGKFCLK
ncbi:unnamed protein product [marine sediment metagenome]|uniref:Uncharacterized protein n=1 Tax=marine sediment metagenome TaxID=412755 RepID=X1GSX7_9ZZZZ